MMDRNVQMEIIAVVGVLGGLSLIMNRPDIASVVVAGLVGFLGGQHIPTNPELDVNTDSSVMGRFMKKI